MFTLANVIIALQQQGAAGNGKSRSRLRIKSSMDFKDENENIECQSPESTRVEMSQIIQSNHVNKSGFLCASQLLKWVDITACLAAENLAGRQCVTVSVDDLYFEEQVSLGEVICLKGQVNRAFNTSMEVGVKVTKEQQESSEKTICEAFLTFVAINDVGKKIKLPPFICETHPEEVCYSLAEERRRLRISHSKTISNLLSNYTTPTTPTERTETELDDKNVVKGSKTRVESVELVLPPHANHHGNTFGGQVMAWMENIGSISVGRFTKEIVHLRSIDMVHFRGPSHVGDRIVLQAVVNCAFEKSLEVGVRVEAYNCDDGSKGERRHINSAFLTYETDAELPLLDPNHGENGIRRYREATARCKIRLDRRYILSSKRQEKLSVVYNEHNSLYLSYGNVSSLSQLSNKTDWKKVSSEDQLTLSTREQDGVLTFKVSKKLCNSKVSDYHAFKILSDPRHRMNWDPLMINCKLIRGQQGVDDCVYHSEMRRTPNDETGVNNDFILLYSCRKPSREGDPYIVAFRSVTIEGVDSLAETGNNRMEVACAGFVIHEEPGEHTEISYYNETNPQIVTYVTGDVAGFSKLYSAVYRSMEKYIVDKL